MFYTASLHIRYTTIYDERRLSRKGIGEICEVLYSAQLVITI